MTCPRRSKRDGRRRESPPARAIRSGAISWPFWRRFLRRSNRDRRALGRVRSGDIAEAKLAKALDKLETIMQHTQGKNPPAFDYRFNLEYGRSHTAGEPLIAAVRAILDAETEQRAQEADTSRD